MALQKYVIRQISALSIIASAVGEYGAWRFSFDATDPSKEFLVEETKQDDCAIYHQAMCVLYGENYQAESDCEKLKDALIYIDFSGTFDERGYSRPVYAINKAECMLGRDGTILNLGRGYAKYLAFERSANMSRNSVLSFVREDLYEPLRERMMLGMKIGKCQLAKLYAYNALMYTSGRRVNDPHLLSEKKIIVIDNPKSTVKNANIVTVEDDGSDDPVRKYTRVEKTADVEVLEFDGEGIISKEMARSLDSSGAHHSFQVRLPYIKGVVHEIDLRGLFSQLGVPKIKDIWGVEHDVNDVQMILTKSMFKGYGWMTENGLSWAEYLERCRKYDHALYISGSDKAERESVTELNYQFLNTLALTEEEFRPADLPRGWDKSPENDSRHWLTKTTEVAYYDYCANAEARLSYFLKDLSNGELKLNNRRRQRAGLLKKNPLYLEESIFTKELSDNAESVRNKYAVGKLLVAGDTRYLSDDLMRLLSYIVKTSVGEGDACKKLTAEELRGNEIYAPSPVFKEQPYYTLLRSPHIARNEEAFVYPLTTVGAIRKKYLSHLYYVLMVDSRSLIPERLGGADYDGDLVRTVADPLVNDCVKKGYDNGKSLPVLKIPSAEPLIADAKDWKARAEAVKSTFSSRVGQISNTALRLGIVAYDENNEDEKRDESRMDTEALAILTGLEIDSAKSGVKPDLTEYLYGRNTKKSVFLRYKTISKDNRDRKWYEQTKEKDIEDFIEEVDWDEVSSNMERLPYYAYMLGQETKQYKPKPAEDEKLFTFASEPDWKDNLDPFSMERVKAVVSAYHAADARIRFIKHLSTDFKRQKDVVRILFSRGQLNTVSAEQLYALFDAAPADSIRKARRALTENKWHLTPKKNRGFVWFSIVPSGVSTEYMDVFCDFRNGGFRLLGDILCDLDELYSNQKILKNIVRDGDSPELKFILSGIRHFSDYKETIVSNCIALLSPPDRRERRVDFDEAVKCAVALGERRFVLEVMPYSALEWTVGPAEKKKRRWFGR
ncbi:MAG: hypothetical protein J5585_10465 [Clostridia bacterium]|nr:hypothetical protein [Clostridia bacterium]